MKFISEEKFNQTCVMNADERSAIRDCLEAVLDCMEWDDHLEEYTDNGQFMLSLSMSDVENLKRVVDVL